MTTHRLIINGLEAPLMKLFGCDCGRCQDPKRQANTSMSLIATNGSQEPTQHVLFDIGLGVVDSLVQIPDFKNGQTRLDWILLTHWHPDHTKELNRSLRFLPTQLQGAWIAYARKGSAVVSQRFGELNGD